MERAARSSRASCVLQVLVVDRSRAIVTSLGSWLGRTGLVSGVKTATTATAALRALASFSPDVALLDTTIEPGGWQPLAKRIRERLPAAQLLLMSAAAPGDLRRLRHDGLIDDFVSKTDLARQLRWKLRKLAL